MYIFSAKLQNYKQHRELNVEFSAFTGIVGNNACGKSNLVSAIRDTLNLNGTFSCKKESLCTWGQKSGSVEIVFSSGRSDEKFVATLCVGKSPGRTITDMAGKVIASTPQATVEFLSSLFGGADQAVVDSLSFARQTESLQILFQKGSMRGKLAQRIVGAGEASKIHALATEALSQIPTVDVEEVMSSLNWLQTHDDDAQARREVLERKIELAAGLPPLDELTSRLAAKTGSSGVSAQRREIQSEIDIANAEIPTLEARHLELRNRLSGKTSAGLRTALRSAEIRETDIARSEELGKLSESISRRIREECDTSPDEREEEEIRAQIRGREEVNPIASLIPAMRDTHACPGCLRDGLTDSQIDKLSAASITAQDRIRELQRRLSGVNATISSRRSTAQKLEAQKSAADRDRCHTEAAKGPPPVSSQRLGLVLEACLEVEKEMADLDSRIGQANMTIGRLESRLRALPELAGHDPLSADELISYRDRVTEATAAQTALVLLDRDTESRAEERSRLQRSLQGEESNREARALLSGLRSIMAYDQAPLAFASARLGDVSEGMSAIISNLGYQYRVAAGSEFDFSYSKDVGRTWAPAEFLSGGEQVSLVLAFRIEIARIYAAGIKLMSLDEPTVWMDEVTKAQFPQILASMRRLADAGGIQFLVSTHDRQVLSCFDSVIDLT